MTAVNDFITRAHALWRVRMAQWQQRFGFFAKLVLLSGGAGAIIAPQFVMSAPELKVAGQCILAKALAILGELAGRDLMMNVSLEGYRATVSAAAFANEPFIAGTFSKAVAVIMIGAVLGCALGLLVVWLIQRTMSSQGRDTLADRVIGGTRLARQEEVAARTRSMSGGGALQIGPVPIPQRIETRHFAFLGTTGSGKTTVLRQMLDGIEARGEAALVYDTSGEFISHYYNPARGDIILNPFDARCAFWSPFDEISHPADADRIARQLVSETGSQDDDVWLETSRILVANMMRSLWAEKNGSLEALLDALQVKSKEQLKAWLGHTSSARTFADDADRATGSVLFMLAKAANLIQFLKVEQENAARFAFRDFIVGLDRIEGASCQSVRPCSRPARWRGRLATMPLAGSATTPSALPLPKQASAVRWSRAPLWTGAGRSLRGLAYLKLSRPSRPCCALKPPGAAMRRRWLRRSVLRARLSAPRGNPRGLALPGPMIRSTRLLRCSPRVTGLRLFRAMPGQPRRRLCLPPMPARRPRAGWQ